MGLPPVAANVTNTVALVFNGVSHAVMLASPIDLEDFGLGFSLSEGIIAQASELYETETRRHAGGIEVHLRIGNRAFDAAPAAAFSPPA